MLSGKRMMKRANIGGKFDPNPVDSRLYLEHFQKFKHMTSKQAPGSLEYEHLHSEFVNKMRLEGKDIGGEMKVKFNTDFWKVLVFGSSTNLETASILYLLRYNRLPFEAVFYNRLQQGRMLRKHGLGENAKFPVVQLISDIPILKPFSADSTQGIYNNLLSRKLVTPIQQYSAYEEQSLNFISNQVIPAFSLYFRRFIHKLQLLSLINPLHIQKSIPYISKFYYQGLWAALEAVLEIYLDMLYKIKHRGESPKAPQILREHLREWIDRVGSNQFHGGQRPDLADIKMYGIVDLYAQTKCIRKLLEDPQFKQFNKWMQKMGSLIKNERFYAGSLNEY